MGNSLLGKKFGAVFLGALFWGPCYSLFFIKNLEDNTSGTVIKFADDTKIFREVRDVHDNIRVQADLDRLVE